MNKEGMESAYRMISWYDSPKMKKKYSDFPSKREINFPKIYPWTFEKLLNNFILELTEELLNDFILELTEKL